MGSLDKEIMLEDKLRDAGNRLLNPPSSVDELLAFLDEAENLLSHVEQAPSKSMQDALFPMMKALISSDLLKHSNADVRVAVVSCITEISRVSAPDAPYSDDLMKEVLQLTVAAFEKLSQVSSRSCRKAQMILDTVAKVRSCLMLLDLECEGLVLEMFQLFFKTIGSNHPHTVFSAMEMIMTTIIDESEDIAFDLLGTILASVRKENQDLSPLSWKLGEKVLKNCARQLKPYIMEAVQSKRLALEIYSPMVASIYQNEISPTGEQNNGHLVKNVDEDNISNKKAVLSEPNEGTSGASTDAACPGEICQPLGINSMPVTNFGNASVQNDENHGVALTKKAKSEIKSETVPKKRGRKPNSLMNPEEGYYHPWISSSKKANKRGSGKKVDNRIADFVPSESPVPQNLQGRASPTFSSKTDKPPKSSQGNISLRRKYQIEIPGTRSNQSKTPGRRRRSKVKPNALSHYADSTPLSALMKRKSGVQVEKKATPEIFMPVKPQPVDGQHTIRTSWKPSGKGRTLVRSDDKKQNSGNVNSIEVANEASGSRRIKGATKPSSQGGVEETPNTSGKRRRRTRKGDIRTSDYGEGLVGKRIKVWWPLDKRFYEGVVDLYDPVKKKHKVLYTDGETEVLKLKRERWEFVEEDTPSMDPPTNLPESHTASDSVEEQVKGSEGNDLPLQMKAGSFVRIRKRSSTGRRRKKANSSVLEAANGDGSGSLVKVTGLLKNTSAKKKRKDGTSTNTTQSAAEKISNDESKTVGKPEK